MDDRDKEPIECECDLVEDIIHLKISTDSQ